MITWKKGRPTKPGIYLRKNPAASQTIRQDIIQGYKGRLLTTSGDGLSVGLKEWHAADTFWWYGPIPDVPE